MAKVTIGALADDNVLAFGDGYRTKRSEHGTPGYRILRVADVADGRVDLDGTDFVSASLAGAIGGKLSEPGDVLLTTKGTVGRVAIYPEGVERAVYSPQLCFFRVLRKDVLDARFLSFWFKSDAFRHQASHRANNTDMAAYINLRDIASLAIELPAIDEQRAIAAVLGALDDKIAANADLARTIDDLVGAFYAQATAAAEVGLLREIADVNTATVKPQTHGSLRYLDIASVAVGSYELPERIKWSDAPGRARRSVRTGDTVWSTVRPNRRSHALVLDECDGLIASTGLAVISPKEGRFAYVYEATRTLAFTSYLEGAAEGSAYPAVRGERFLSAPARVLPPNDADRFEGVAAPLRRRSHAATVESRALSALRDSLLPHLMSGKLTVKDAERVVEGVV